MTYTYYIDTDCKVSDGSMACVVDTTMSFEDVNGMIDTLTAQDPDAEFVEIAEPEYVTEDMICW